MASLIFYLIDAYLPVDPKLKNIVKAILVIIVIIWLLRLVWPYITTL